MSIRFKIPRALALAVRADLAREHEFAAERIGFIGAQACAAHDDLFVLAHSYRAVADEDYIENPQVGAMIGPTAIRKALQWALNGVGVFHVHAHGGSGIPRFSLADLSDQKLQLPSFVQMAPHLPHGAIVFNQTRAAGNVWLISKPGLTPIGEFVEVGAPLRSWRNA